MVTVSITHNIDVEDLMVAFVKQPDALVELIDTLGAVIDDLPVPRTILDLDGINAANLIACRFWLNEVIAAVYTLNNKEKDPA